MPHEFVRPFHFWCQKVLPLVFDDSLSYYEVLAKMRDYLNEAIQEINNIGGEFDGVKTQLTQLQTHVDEYFAELDVNQAISDKLDDMVESGEMDAVITPIFAAYANPLFAASVADMIATNFAYANYENNKIYTFNQSTGLYQTTGKEFGGVVSSVGEMGDRDKYYALDSNGMLYSYDYPESAFIESGLTYGGYRYGVNAMRPIANTYVLTTDGHVYTWNGVEYTDTGVVYGLPNNTLSYRRTLNETDDVTNLLTDGWYLLDKQNPPNGTPENAQISDGFVLSYTLSAPTDFSRNIQTAIADNLEANNNRLIRANRTQKCVVIYYLNGGSWFWNGSAWFNQNENGIKAAENCNNINYNSVVVCDETTVNKPYGENQGLLKTFVSDNMNSQMFFGSSLWTRNNNSTWIAIANQQSVENVAATLDAIQLGLSALNTELQIQKNNTQTALNNIANDMNAKFSLIFGNYEMLVQCENGNLLICENGAFVSCYTLGLKTDKTLTVDNMAADSATVGKALSEMQANSDYRFEGLESRITDVANKTETTTALTEYKFQTILAPNSENCCAENLSVICSETGTPIGTNSYGIKTDKTLNSPDLPANALSVRAEIESLSAKTEQQLQEKANKSELATLKTTADKINAITNNFSVVAFVITSESGDIICGSNWLPLFGEKTGVKCDVTLTEANAPADSQATGLAIARVDEKTQQLEQRINAIPDNQEQIEQLQRNVDTIYANTMTANYTWISTQNLTPITTENGDNISKARYVAKVDNTLSEKGTAADAYAVGEALKAVKINATNYNAVVSGNDSSQWWFTPTVELFGELPLTKTNVNITCRITQNNHVIYYGSAKIKVQGSGSLNNPEKNYTLKLNNSVAIFGYVLQTWVLKCNWADSSQCRNIVGARTFNRMLHSILPNRTAHNLVSFHGTNTITTENNDTIQILEYTLPIQKSPHWGTTDGDFVYLYHDGEFHGIYTMQIPKNDSMFGMDLSSNQFMLSATRWYFSPLADISAFNAALEIEEASDDMTETVIMNKINSLATFIRDSSDEDFRNGISNYMNPDIVVAYILLCLWIQHIDGVSRNYLLYSYDGGNTINISAYDMDSVMGIGWGAVQWFIPGYAHATYQSNEYTGTNALNGQTTLQNLARDNALFARFISACPDWLKTQWTNMRNTVLKPGATLFDFMCLLGHTHKTMWNLDAEKWTNKPKTMFSDVGMAMAWLNANIAEVDAQINSL